MEQRTPLPIYTPMERSPPTHSSRYLGLDRAEGVNDFHEVVAQVHDLSHVTHVNDLRPESWHTCK